MGGLEDRQLKYLSATHAGKKHDKKGCAEEKIVVPAGSHLYQDTGFQGYPIPEVTIPQPQKQPRGGERTRADKIQNCLISGVRVVIEPIIAGVKRGRMVKDVFRNTKDDYDDRVMELACGLPNFRSDNRLVCY